MAELKSQFTASSKIGKAPLTVNFTNTSTGPFDSVTWNFGDGGSSNEIHPSHQYNIDGTFQVTLSIHDNGADQTVNSQQTISVFPDNEEDISGSTEQSTLNVTKRFEPGQVQVVQEVLTGTTYNADVFFGTELHQMGFGKSPFNSNAVYLAVKTATWNAATGVFTAQTTTDNDTGLMDEFDAWWTANGTDIDYSKCLIGFVLQSPSIAEDNFTNSSIDRFDPSELWDHVDFTTPRNQIVWHKIEDITKDGGTGSSSQFTFTVERDLPWRGETGLLSAWVIMNTDIDSSGSYVGNEFDDPDKIYPKIHFGIDGLEKQWFNSGVYNVNHSANGILRKTGCSGLENHLGIEKAIIYPDSASISSANALAPGSNHIYIPWLQTSKEERYGLSLWDEYGGTEIDPDSGLRFGYMRAGKTEDARIYGRIFYDLKCTIIDELDANVALQNNSNRCYMLDPINVQRTTNTDSWTVSGVTYYITYTPCFPSHGASGNTDTFGLGGVRVFPCGNITSFTCQEDGEEFFIQTPMSNKMVPDTTASGNTQGGWIPLATNIVSILIATGTTTEIDADSWKCCDTEYTGDIVAGYVLDKNYYNPDMEPVSWGANGPLSELGQSAFTPGDETIFIGNISGNLETVSYKISATCVAKNTEFNQTQNETHTSGATYISEVGIYNENNDLLMVGKLNKPIKKNEEKYVVIKMELDL